MAHLRAYYDQFVGVGRDEALLMRLLRRSLRGRLWSGSPPTKPDNEQAGIL